MDKKGNIWHFLPHHLLPAQLGAAMTQSIGKLFPLLCLLLGLACLGVAGYVQAIEPAPAMVLTSP
mgnify:CR=1 FL=1